MHCGLTPSVESTGWTNRYALLLVCALTSSSCLLPAVTAHCVATKVTCFRDDPEMRVLPCLLHSMSCSLVVCAMISCVVVESSVLV